MDLPALSALLAEAFSHCTEPLSNLPFMDLHLHYELEPLSAEETGLKLRAGFPTGLIEDDFITQLQQKLKQLAPQQQWQIHLESFIAAHQTQMPGSGLRGVKNVIAVGSGKGGVGKSTVTLNLALALAKAGARVGLLDADIYGPSIPLMLGTEQTKALFEEDGYLPVFAQGIYAMSIGYLTNLQQALIWRGPMLSKALLEMINLTRWDNLDYLLIDLPPGTGDIQLSLVQKIPLTGAIVVTTPQQLATLDAEKAIQMFKKTGISVLGCIENMAHYHCEHCGHAANIFDSKQAKQGHERLQEKFLGQLPLDARLRQQGDAELVLDFEEKHDLSQELKKIALRTAIEVAKKPLNIGDKFPKIRVE